MAAGIKTLFNCIVLSSCFFISSSGFCADNTSVTNEEIIAYLLKDVSDKYTSLEKTIENCYQQRDTAKVKVTAEQINKRFEEAGLTWKDAMSAVLYIGERNDDLCSHEARANLLYAATSFQKTMEALGTKVVFEVEGDKYTFTELIDMALHPTPEIYRIVVKYERLPGEVKDYMESSFGKTPFPHLQLMEAISPNSRK